MLLSAWNGQVNKSNPYRRKTMKSRHHYGSTIGEILDRSQARYLRVLPTGLAFPDGRVLQSVSVTIRRHHPARTLYRNRRPVCRSLDGSNPLTNTKKSCVTCLERPTCTPQILLTILVKLEPFYLLLSHTSLRNFIHFTQHKTLGQHDSILIKILKHQHWGEITFLEPKEQPTLFDNL